MMSRSGFTDYERLLQDGIQAAKNDQRRLAQSLLHQAILLNSCDARPYVWLSAVTEDPDEQRQYLEEAVSIEPTNAAARHGLALLAGKVAESRGSQAYTPPEPGARKNSPAAEQDAQARTFLCPQCGGAMSFSAERGQLACHYCGYTQAPLEAAPVAEGVLDFAMHSPVGHSWAEAQMRLTCERCGALNLLPPGQKTGQCPYCGSHALIQSPELGELLDPHAILPMKLDEAQAGRKVRDWLGRGLFAPDDLLHTVQHVRLRPAYYSCWMFDGSIEVRWTCEVNVGSDRNQRWEPRSGAEMRFFDNILVTGVRALQQDELESIEPFNLAELVEFQPEFVAGWPTLIYDHALSDASMVARDKVFRSLKAEVDSFAEPGREKRNLETRGAKTSGVTFQHLLLPVWMGSYTYQGKPYHLLVNGQTGKVGGAKPRDGVKVLFAVMIGLLFLIVAGVLLYALFNGA